MNRSRYSLVLSLLVCSIAASHAGAADVIPRPEHPTPDAVRPHWLNLNGKWEFRFDPKDEGLRQDWSRPGAAGFDRAIVVPFGWESALSGIHDTKFKGVAWYRRSFRVPADFPAAERLWLHFGAVDWKADVWVNGRHVAAHEGGYTPFSADITAAAPRGEPVVVTVRAYDPTSPGLPTGKQVRWYTPTSGIWQTVWLESRPRAQIAGFTAVTKVEPGLGSVNYRVRLEGLKPGSAYTLSLGSEDHVSRLEFTADKADWEDSIGGPRSTAPRLWTPEDPYLRDVTLELRGPDGAVDSVRTYYGLRSIARGRYGDEPFERILLNGKPVYLRAALDQSFNPQGVYTAPSDDFLKADIALARLLGLNGLRIHIKPDEPRRLYWADKLGILILEDMPNTWEQNAEARRAWEQTMREVVVRDRNHPSIVAWVAFNETWGLGRPPAYKADRDTQQWVGRMVSAIRALDPSRLVEDNSPCNYDHIENTDLNSWHFYIDDHEAARRHIAEVARRTEPGSSFNYCPGLKQSTAPLINSEYGSVSAGGGDRDVSWGFRDLTTMLRRQPKIQGYVYTELADIEWEHNGFVNYDRSPKDFGYGAFVPGMTVADLQGADFIGYEGPPAIVARPGEEVSVPVFVSHYSQRKGPARLKWTLKEVFAFGNVQEIAQNVGAPINWAQYGVTRLDPIKVRVPEAACAGAIGLELLDEQGRRIAANFVNLVVCPEKPRPRVETSSVDRDNLVLVRFSPADYARSRWTGRSGNPPGKVYGEGRGALEYRFKLPEAVIKSVPQELKLWAELSSRAGPAKLDWPARTNPQDYPQTDARKWPSTVRLTVNGVELGRRDLPDDPADAQGVLSHLARLEHGSHGTIVGLGGPLPERVKADLAAGKPLIVRLSVPKDAPHAGGLSLFGAELGAYPFEPTLAIRTRDPVASPVVADPDQPLTIDTVASRRSVLLTAGEMPGTPATWAYTEKQPPPRWNAIEFDDHSWKQGKAGFGTPGTPALRAASLWKSPRLWMRTHVTLPEMGPQDTLVLRVFHDEDVAVFVNGKVLLREKGYTTTYRDVVLSKGRRALFHAGDNVIAVSCRQTRGGQGVDLGLVLQRQD
jgi:hypothetical protein